MPGWGLKESGDGGMKDESLDTARRLRSMDLMKQTALKRGRLEGAAVTFLVMIVVIFLL